MSFVRMILLGLLGLALLFLALANLQSVDVGLLPGPLASLADYVFGGADAARAPGDRPYSIDGVPLFLVILVSAALGMAIGFTWEWLREHKHRAQAARERAERERLERKLQKAGPAAEDDEVLAIVERRA